MPTPDQSGSHLLNKNTIRRRLFFTAIAGVLLAYILVPIILGEDAYVTIHDNLDGEFVYKLLLKESGQAFNYNTDAVIPNVMNGIPRSAYRTGLDVTLLLFYLFHPYYAYIANHTIIHLIAFFGMVLLLKRHFLKDDRLLPIAVLISLCFALVPFYSQFGLSVAGQPLLLFAFLNIREHQSKFTDYLIIMLFPFYSHFALVAPFILAFLILIMALDLAGSRSWNKSYLGAVALLTVTYLLVESQMLLAFFMNNAFTSHRSVWNRWQDLHLASNLKRSFDILLHTQYHTGTFPTIIILTTSIAAMVLMIARKKINRPVVFIAASILFICLISGFHDWIVFMLGNRISALKSFNISRFYFLLPTLWMLLMALSILELAKYKVIAPLVWFIVIAQLAVTLNANDEFKYNVKLILGRPIDQPTFRQFFAQQLFSGIDQYIKIPKDSYRVVSIGLHPSIAQYNGYYTLDSYQVNYSLQYKNSFRRIIAPELNKNQELKKYFDDWGNRCYVFVDELGKGTTFSKNDTKKIHSLDLDTRAFKDMGGKYIFSSVEIVNHQQNNLKFESHFSNVESYWDIYLYRVM